MNKLLKIALAIVLLLLATLGLLLASGVVSPGSFRMLANVMFGVEGPATSDSTARERLSLPPGFSLQVYADDVPGARMLSFTPAGDLLVSRPHKGDIVLLRRDANGDGRHDGRESVIGDLKRPHGMDFYRGWLYIAERDRVGRINFSSGRGIGRYREVLSELPGDGNHWSKTLRTGPDGLIYLTVGSTCNICEERDPRRATMMRFRPDGRDTEIVATGLRNSVGFDWAPWDGALYATDNGRDMLGDNFPACELNRIEQGKFYGWPYFNDANVPDPDMGPDPLSSQRTPSAPAHRFRAHNSPLGIRFVDTRGWPGDYDRVALVALHGSWNRSTPDGYKVVSLHFNGNGIEERDFLNGFLHDKTVLGRPVDVIQGPNGDIFVSDDYAGAVYRISVVAAGSNAVPATEGTRDRVNSAQPE